MIIDSYLITTHIGQKSTYKCSKCDYSVMTSAGLDYGMLAVVDTYTCLKCKNIVDVSVGEYGNVIPKEEIAKNPDINPYLDFYKCVECGDDSALVKWNKRKRPCSKCDGKMQVDKSAGEIMWD